LGKFFVTLNKIMSPGLSIGPALEASGLAVVSVGSGLVFVEGERNNSKVTLVWLVFSFCFRTPTLPPILAFFVRSKDRSEEKTVGGVS